MVRRVAALLGIVLILVIVAALVWTVYQHKAKTTIEPAADDVVVLTAPIHQESEVSL